MPRPLLVPLALSALLALTACTGGDGPADGPAAAGSSAPSPAGTVDAAALRAAPATLSKAGSARYALDTQVVVGDGQPVVLRGEGAVDVASGEQELTVTLPAGQVQQRTVDGRVYLALPGQEGVFYGLDLEDVQGTLLGITDPTATSAALGAVRDVRSTGQEEVRGEPTTRYAGVVVVQEAVEAADPRVRSFLAQTIGRSGLEEVPFTAWLDDDGRLRRYVQELEVSTGGQPARTTTTLELFDFGTQVDVQAPPASAVRDGAPLLRQLQGAPPAGAASPPASPSASPS